MTMAQCIVMKSIYRVTQIRELITLTMHVAGCEFVSSASKLSSLQAHRLHAFSSQLSDWRDTGVNVSNV